MAKEKISVTVDATALAATDADGRAVGLNRSEMIEQALRNEHLRVALQNYTTRTVPALDIAVASDRNTTVPGATVGYVITIHNSGQTDYPSAAVDVALAGALDDGTYAGGATASCRAIASRT